MYCCEFENLQYTKCVAKFLDLHQDKFVFEGKIPLTSLGALNEWGLHMLINRQHVTINA